MVRLSGECSGFIVFGQCPDSLMVRARLEPLNKGATVHQFTIGYEADPTPGSNQAGCLVHINAEPPQVADTLPLNGVIYLRGLSNVCSIPSMRQVACLMASQRSARACAPRALASATQAAGAIEGCPASWGGAGLYSIAS